MWLFTTRGFYSVVESDVDPSKVVVRARVLDDLVALSDLIPDMPEPIALPGRDYEWRVFVPKAAWESAAGALAREVDYGNFKDAVKARQGWERSSIYLRVWGALLSLAPRRFVDDGLPLPLFDDDDAPLEMAICDESGEFVEWMERDARDETSEFLRPWGDAT